MLEQKAQITFQPKEHVRIFTVIRRTNATDRVAPPTNHCDRFGARVPQVPKPRHHLLLDVAQPNSPPAVRCRERMQPVTDLQVTRVRRRWLVGRNELVDSPGPRSEHPCPRCGALALPTLLDRFTSPGVVRRPASRAG